MQVEGDMMDNSKFLGTRFVNINQQYDDWHDRLDIGDAGSFRTNYIKGRDKTKPVVVINNTDWPIKESIKGKTEAFKIQDGFGNRHTARNTNSNHGEFDFDETTQFGDIACPASCSPAPKPDQKKHNH